MCFKALPLRKKRRKGESPRKIPKVTDRTTELQVALVPKFINYPELFLGRKRLSRRTILGSELNREGGREKWGTFPSQMALVCLCDHLSGIWPSNVSLCCLPLQQVGTEDPGKCFVGQAHNLVNSFFHSLSFLLFPLRESPRQFLAIANIHMLQMD